MNQAKPCQRCNGTGHEPDLVAAGRYYRRRRTKAGKTLDQVAGMMGISPSYLCDLELGHRRFSADRIAQFERAIAGVKELPMLQPKGKNHQRSKKRHPFETITQIKLTTET